MSVFGSRYVVDTNALTHLGRARRASEFFRDNAVIPTEVLHEAAGFPDLLELSANSYETSPRVLELLVDVMATVDTDDNRLVNLYKNLGGADPLVIACALAGQEDDNQYLTAPDWVIVTGDGAVAAKASEFNLEVIDAATLAALIDEAGDTAAAHGRNKPAT